MPKLNPGKARKGNVKPRTSKRPAATRKKSSGSKLNNIKGALVIGGGISGIQAALDLAESGVYTYLLERSPSIGGRMAQLDKTFPTNDCAMCILSPKLVTVARHPNIKLLTNSELLHVTGKAPNFKVSVKKHPRYVDENKCVGCGECAAKCPVKVPNEFDLGLGYRKAIYIQFPQAVPLVYSIDPQNCKYLQTGKCGVCAKICKAKAVDFEQKPEVIGLDIGAIIVATGYDQFNPSGLEELGYGVYPNVITGLEFERMLNAAGPTQGKIIRRSDGKAPKNILFIQCVGSRDKHRAFEYCSRICCMYAIKEAMIAREHQPTLKGKDIKILNMEIRAYGKGFEEYYHRASAEGIDFIQGRAAEIVEDSKTNNLVVRIEAVEDGDLREIQTELVVLSSAVIPKDSNKEISKILSIGLDSHGFFLEMDSLQSQEQKRVQRKAQKQKDQTFTLGVEGVLSTRPGIFLAGCAQGPKDIPDSVSQGSAAAALAGGFLTDSKIKPETVKLPMPATESEGLRIGVFVCHCGINIGGVLNVPELVKYAKTLPDVVFSTDNLYTCSDDAQGLIQDRIKEHNLNRVIVASCTPRTHEPIFRDTCARAGLNPFLFEMVNIRDQCSWVHRDEPELGTEKAKDLLRMAVARAHHLQPLQTFSLPLTRSVLIIGGGIAGMESARALANQGIDTTLVEQEPVLGGRLNQLHTLAHVQITPEKLIAQKTRELRSAGVNILTNTKISDIQGYVGNFKISLEKSKSHPAAKSKTKPEELTAGAIILAIGSGLFDPAVEKEYGYSLNSNVITNQELEELIKAGKLNKKLKNVTFIQCVGSRESHKKAGNPACSRYCCQTALNQALTLARLGSNVTVLHKGIRAFSKYAEELYYEASEQGVRFIQFPEDRIPTVNKKGTQVQVTDVALNQKVTLPTDLIVLTVGMRPNQAATEQLQGWLKVPRSPDGFFLELHPKLGPVETNTVGIYLCGCSQGPKDITDTLSQASAAAAKVAALFSSDELLVEPITACVDESLCWGCGTCEEHCPYGAVRVEVTKEGKKISQVNQALCKGCGVCASQCPSGAMSIWHYSNLQITSMIQAFGEEV